MRVGEKVEISAPIDRVWAVVSDPERILSFMSGVTRWEVDGDRDGGLGARYRVLFRVGAAEIGGLLRSGGKDGGRGDPRCFFSRLRISGFHG